MADSDNNNNKSLFCYAMGFLPPGPAGAEEVQRQKKKIESKKKRSSTGGSSGQPPQLCVVANSSNGVVELFVMSDDGRFRDEAEWTAHLRARFAGLALQTVDIVADPVQGRACVARLMTLRGLGDVAALEREGFLDAYRAASGGVLHVLDQRPLRMPPTLIQRLQAERLVMQTDLHQLIERQGELELFIAHLQFILQNVRLVLPLSSLRIGVDDDDTEMIVLREMMLLLPDFIAILTHNERQLERLEHEELALLQRVHELQTRFDELSEVLQHQTQLLIVPVALAGLTEEEETARKKQRV